MTLVLAFLKIDILCKYIFVLLIKITIQFNMQKNIAQIREHKRRPKPNPSTKPNLCP